MSTTVTVKPNNQAVDEADAKAPDVIIDAKGRKLMLRELSVLEESRLVRAMGQDAVNGSYMTGYVMPAAMVAEIDGSPCRLPSSQATVDAALQRLGRDGLAAVMTHLLSRAEQQDQRRADGLTEETANLKKSAGIPDSSNPAI